MSAASLASLCLVLLGANALRVRLSRWRDRVDGTAPTPDVLGPRVLAALGITAVPLTWLSLTGLVASGLPTGIHSAHGWNAPVSALVTLGAAHAALSILLRLFDLVERAASRSSGRA